MYIHYFLNQNTSFVNFTTLETYELITVLIKIWLFLGIYYYTYF